MKNHPENRAFTLLEVVIALAILAVSLVVLVDSQATAVLMTLETDRIFTATMLAEEKMAELQMRVESEGFTDTDYEEEGDFDDYQVEGLEIDFEIDDLGEYKWAYTFRQIDISMAMDVGNMMGDLDEGGYFGEEEETSDASSPDLGDMGVDPDMIADYLGDYIREVRVIVWWGDNEDDLDQVELISHTVNPTGAVTASEDEG